MQEVEVERALILLQLLVEQVEAEEVLAPELQQLQDLQTQVEVVVEMVEVVDLA
jgi:hypothetical protein